MTLVCADRLLAHVTRPDGDTLRARVVLTRDPCELIVYTAAGREVRETVRCEWFPAASDVDPHDGEATWTVATSIGGFVVVSGGGCAGCGDALAAFQPWYPYRWAKLPVVERSRP